MVVSLVLVAALSISPKELREAKRLTRQSILEYNSGDFEPALRDAKRAYQLSGAPALLFDIAQCYRALGRWKEAEFSYRGYLREQKVVHNRTEAVLLLAEMEARQRAAAPPEPVVNRAPAPSPPPPPVLILTHLAPVPAPPATAAGPASRRSAPAAAVSAPPPRRRIEPAVWWVGGAGVATALAGTVFGVAAGDLAAQDHPSLSGAYRYHDLSPSRYASEQASGLTADILWGTGAALVVTAAVLAWTSR